MKFKKEWVIIAILIVIIVIQTITFSHKYDSMQNEISNQQATIESMQRIITNSQNVIEIIQKEYEKKMRDYIK